LTCGGLAFCGFVIVPLHAMSEVTERTEVLRLEPAYALGSLLGVAVPGGSPEARLAYA
jgi:hypothetical protein